MVQIEIFRQKEYNLRSSGILNGEKKILTNQQIDAISMKE